MSETKPTSVPETAIAGHGGKAAHTPTRMTERSRCWACNGGGVLRPLIPTTVEEPWAWNHFGPEPGDVEDGDGF